LFCGNTKYGDGGVDILPLGGLLKTQVRQLANELGIPEEIIKRTPSAGLWEGQTDEGELGITYEELDEVLIAIEGGDTEGYEPQTLEKVKRMIRNSEHKREKIPVFEDEGAA
jgi:NAD+ synthase